MKSKSAKLREFEDLTREVNNFLSEMHWMPTDWTIKESERLRKLTSEALGPAEGVKITRINSNPPPPSGGRPTAPKAPPKSGA